MNPWPKGHATGESVVGGFSPERLIWVIPWPKGHATSESVVGGFSPEG
ncbi:hypothetical protein AB6T38_06840 [Aliiglaciecola sp. SL4]